MSAEKGKTNPEENLEPKQEIISLPADLQKKVDDLELMKKRQDTLPDWVKESAEKNIERIQKQIDKEKEKLHSIFEQEINPEFAKELRETAKLSNTPENLAMMNPELRKSLENIRKNHKIYFLGHAQGNECPSGDSEWSITTNKKGFEDLNSQNKKANLDSIGELYVGFGNSSRMLDGTFDKQPHFTRDNVMERVALSPTKTGDWTVAYKYTSHDMESSDGRPGAGLRVGLALPEEEAKKVYEQLVSHPEYCREFFVCAARDTVGKFVEIILEGKPVKSARMPDWNKTDNKREILFFSNDGDECSLRQIAIKDGKLKEVPLSEEFKRWQEKYNWEINENKRSAENRKIKEEKRANRGFIKKSFIKAYEFFTGDYNRF